MTFATAPHDAASASAPASATRGICEISVREPFPWRALLRYLGARAIAGHERTDGEIYERLDAAGNPTCRVRFDAAHHRLLVGSADPATTADDGARAGRLFAAAYDPAEARALAADPIVGPRLRALPGLRPLGAWDAFELCVRTLVGQQVSVAAAQSLTARIVERCGRLEAQTLAAADLKNIGMPGKRVAAIQHFARAVAAGRIDLRADWSDLEPALAAQPGFGPWTRSYLAIRLGRDPDALPTADAGLLRATGCDKPRSLETLAERWRPHRALAATYLWMLPERGDDPSNHS